MYDIINDIFIKSLPSSYFHNQLWIHINASIMSDLSQLCCFVTLFLVMLKVDSDATIEFGMTNTFLAIFYNVGNLEPLHFPHINMLKISSFSNNFSTK